MKILSVTNKKTQLHKSPSDLGVICSHEHKEKRTVSTDVSFFLSSSSPQCYLQNYKSSDILEIFRIKSGKKGTEVIDRLRKYAKNPGIQAVAGGKDREAKPEYAVGYTTGQIKIFELNSTNTCKAEFAPDTNKASVISLDYSNCGGYLSSVYENGLINIYGLTTKIKSDTITLDKESSLARFHPAKRFQLAVASFKGTVTMFDIASKKISFQERLAHDAPCRDLAMCEDSPDRLFTCGCDSFIKIFDTRKKGSGLQIQSHCGLSTISVSKCGGFFVVGNLKGDLLSYDMRSLRQPLSKMKLDNELVTRVIFLPNWGDSVSTFPSMSQRDSTESTASDELPEPPEVQDDFTMEDIVGFKKGRVSEFDMSCSSRVSAIRPSESRRDSEAYINKLENLMNDTFGSDSSINANSPKSIVDVRKKDSITKRRTSFMPSPLHRIREEQSDKENQSQTLNSPDNMTGPRFSSTPAPPLKQVEISNEEIIDVDALDASVHEVACGGTSEEKQANTILPSSFVGVVPQFDMKKEFEALQAGINEKISFEVQSLNFDLNGRHMEMMTYIFNQRRQLQTRIDMIEECMGMLLSDDAKISKIMELQDENRQLKEQLNNLMNRMNI